MYDYEKCYEKKLRSYEQEQKKLKHKKNREQQKIFSKFLCSIFFLINNFTFLALSSTIFVLLTVL